MYHYLRVESKDINSAMVQSTYRTVEARYKTVRQQLFQHPYHFQDKNTGSGIGLIEILAGYTSQLSLAVHKQIMCRI